ncbi:MAG: hypothetical protein AB7G11_06000 [Phycisphaerales bacterium]
MRCKTCNYALWNLPSRQCPECGTPFRPSDFTFVPNAVRFECPHCRQPYYGTDASGHLVPRTFDCGQCGQRIDMDEMILNPTEGVKEESTAQAVFPWVHRENRSVLSAWFASVGMSLTKPGQMMRSLPESSVVGKSWTFFLCNIGVIALCVLLPSLLLFIPLMFAARPGPAPGGGGGGPPVGMFSVLLFTLGGFILAFVIALIVVTPIWACIAHGLLRITGPCAGGLGRTVESVLFSSGANVLSAIPCVGGYIGPIWWIVSAVIATKDRQRVSGGRASFAIITSWVLIIVAGIVVYILSVALIVGLGGAGPRMTGRPFPTGGAMTAADTQTHLESLHGTIRQFAAQHQGILPDHPLRYFEISGVTGGTFIAPNSMTSTITKFASGLSLADFELADNQTRGFMINNALTAVSSDPSAIRLGDVIFTSQNLPIESADPDLWLIVSYPDPGANPPWTFGSLISVLAADGSIRTVNPANLSAEVESQNQLRVKLGLAPLPDLKRVK